MVIKARKNISPAKAPSDPQDGSASLSPVGKSRAKRFKLWKVLLLSGLCLIVLALIFIWTQRYNLIEAHIEKLADESNFDVSLDIKSIDLAQTQVENIVLRQDGRDVFKAQSVILDYDWRELKDNNQLQKAVIQSPQIWVELHRSGKVVFPALQPGEGAAIPLPPGGVVFKTGQIELGSPYLRLQSAFDGYFKSVSDMQISLDIDHSDLNYDSGQEQIFSGQGRGSVKLALMDEASEFDIDIHFPNVSWKDNALEGLRLQSRFRPEIDEDSVEFNGPFQARIAKAQTPDFSLQNADLKWDLSLIHI